jgi:hypothetical protein
MCYVNALFFISFPVKKIRSYLRTHAFGPEVSPLSKAQNRVSGIISLVLSRLFLPMLLIYTFYKFFFKAMKASRINK